MGVVGGGKCPMHMLIGRGTYKSNSCSKSGSKSDI